MSLLRSLSIEIIIGISVFLTRLPWISNGLGMDSDGDRVLNAAINLARTGVYNPSRFPAYPLPEYVDGLLVYFDLSSPFWLNLPVALLSGVCSGVIYYWFKSFSPIKGALIALAFAFTPAVYLASTGPLDYLYGITFITLSLAVPRRYVIQKGVFLGLAASSRLSYVFGVVPVVLLFLDKLSWENVKANSKNMVLICLVSGAVTILFELPLYVHYKLAWLHFEDDFDLKETIQLLVGNTTFRMFGVLGSVCVYALIAAAVYNFKKNRELFKQPVFRPLLVMAVIYFLVFLRLPHEAAYLMPVLLPLYAFLVLSLPKYYSFALIFCLAVSNLLGSVVKDDIGGVRLLWKGPLLLTKAKEDQWACIDHLARDFMSKQDANVYLIGGTTLCPKARRWGLDAASRVVEFVKKTPEGVLTAAHDNTALPANARFYLLDVWIRQQQHHWKFTSDFSYELLHTVETCGRPD